MWEYKFRASVAVSPKFTVFNLKTKIVFESVDSNIKNKEQGAYHTLPALLLWSKKEK